MWEDSVYQWRANDKRACIFDLATELKSLGQVMPHAKSNQEWKRWFSASKYACRWIAAARMRRRCLIGRALLLVEYEKYYAGAPHSQDGCDPAGKMREEDHRSKMQKFRRKRYKDDPALKLQYKYGLFPAQGEAYHVPVLDEENWVVGLRKIVVQE